MADLHIIDDLGSAVVREIVNLLGDTDLMNAHTLPNGSGTAWQDNEAHADPIPIYVANGEKFLKGIFIVPAQNIASDAADNVTLTFRFRDTSAGTDTVIVAFNTIAADMGTDPMVALTRYSMRDDIQGASTRFPADGQVMADGDSITLEITAAANGRPIAGLGIFLAFDSFAHRIVLEPAGIPDYPRFREAARTGTIS